MEPAIGTYCWQTHGPIPFGQTSLAHGASITADRLRPDDRVRSISLALFHLLGFVPFTSWPAQCRCTVDDMPPFGPSASLGSDSGTCPSVPPGYIDGRGMRGRLHAIACILVRRDMCAGTIRVFHELTNAIGGVQQATPKDRLTKYHFGFFTSWTLGIHPRAITIHSTFT
jgi:hypothetical protein